MLHYALSNDDRFAQYVEHGWIFFQKRYDGMLFLNGDSSCHHAIMARTVLPQCRRRGDSLVCVDGEQPTPQLGRAVRDVVGESAQVGARGERLQEILAGRGCGDEDPGGTRVRG